jgi:molybdate transport system ATP-binding protein
MGDKTLVCNENEIRFKLNYTGSKQAIFKLNVDISIPQQGVTAIFGESGSGKTTLLRCIAGLEKAKSGYLKVNGELWQSDSVFIPTHKRALGYVFQEASLFEHLTVTGNLQYAIKRSRQPPVPKLLEQVVNVMGITDLLQQLPHQLSGGQRQRVAIARAVLCQPKLLIMDEPLASLDTTRKYEILPYLEQLHCNFNIPILYVSHSIDEIVRLADHALIMRSGQVIAQGSLTDLFSRTDLALGVGNEVGAIVECNVVEIDHKWHLIRVAFDGGELWLPHIKNKQISEQNNKQRVRILASDVSLTVTPHTDSSILNVLSGQVTEVTQDKDSAMSLIKLKVGKTYLLARLSQK